MVFVGNVAACQPGSAAPVETAKAAHTRLVDESTLPKLPRFEVSDIDASKPICQDLDAHVNGKWLSQNPVPADKTTWGSFEMLDERSLAVQKQIVEAAAKAGAASGTVQQKIGDLFAAGMNEAKLQEDGLSPVKPLLGEIDGLKDPAGISSYLRSRFAKGQQFVFGFGPAEDFKDAKNVIGYAMQAGLSLPEKAYYSEEKYQDKRDAFLSHVERMLVLGGVDAAAAKTQAKAVLVFETRLAAASMSPVEMRDPANLYNFVTLDQADKATPNFSWTKLFEAQRLSGVKGFSLSQPKFFAEFDKMLVDVPAADWQAYLRYHVLVEAAPYLNDAVADERFAFYGKVMRGQEQQKPRWKRVLDTINGTMGEALGQIYVEQVFPEESKTQMLALVNNLREALKVRLEKLDWMSAETKAKALEKWSTFTPKIGYPDKWRDYSGLTIRRDDSYLTSVLEAAAFENAFQMSKIGKPADPKEWAMAPQVVNAYYNPLKNEIVFPAAILQPPFFDPKADPALNYGGIGAVIGHEMLHGYDDMGSQFDAQGNNKNWWTEADMKNFKARTGKLVAQFDEYVAIDDLHVKGELTLGENIADLGGLTVAFDALNRALTNVRVAQIDGYSQEQRFFLNWATVWRRNYRPEELRVRLNTDPHAPARFRAIGAPSNLDAFASAFQCKPTDPMVRTGDKRLVIW
ncbi:MAG: M13 family metallopeptidase [Polyangiaceae bacterium]|nr:M13 family metallopeptidase [Polyangiaceae bacterium]